MARLVLIVALLAFTLPARAAGVRVVVLGDSLAAGYGVKADEAFPARLEAALRANGYDVTVANAGVSGDTTQGGLARLAWAVAPGTDVAIVELAANDALRGIDPARTRANLAEIVKTLKQRRIAVLLAGMRAPPNMGADYARRFDAIYPALARQYGVALYPFFLAGVAGRADLNQNDGMHPTAAGIEVIVKAILPTVMAVIDKVMAARR